MDKNIDLEVVKGFGDEWSRFDQSAVSATEMSDLFQSFFSIFPWHKLSEKSVGFDLGCGSGRWAKLVAPRVGRLHCIDASADALKVAETNLQEIKTCEFHLASVDEIPLENDTADFGYSLGVLHHVPDTEKGLNSCVAKLKKSAPFLLYLYYRFDNRPLWYRLLWQSSEVFRFLISRSPYPVRYLTSQIFACFVYWPLARLAITLEKVGFKQVDSLPLSFYRHKSLYVMRTDALDRFGTRLEQRFTKEEIRQMMERAGLENIIFSDKAPYWCAVGYKK